MSPAPTPAALSRAQPPSREKKRRRSRWLRRAIGIIAAAAGVGGVVYAAWPKPLPVDVASVARGRLVATIDEPGRTRVRDRHVVAAPLGGSLLRIELRPGDTIEDGAVVARIVPLVPALLDARSRAESQARVASAAAAERQARSAVARTEVAAAHAATEQERTRRLVESGSLPPDALVHAELETKLRSEERVSAQFALQASAHEAVMAATALRSFDARSPSDHFDVTSPAAGRVLRVLQPSAGPVQAGAGLVEVGDPAHLEVVVDLLTADAVRLRPGARASVERWGGEAVAAHVRTIEPSAFTRLSAMGVEEQRVAVIVDIDDPREKWKALGDGYRVETRVVLAERESVLRVPLGSIFRSGDGWAAWVVRGDRIQLAPIGIGIRSDAEAEVISGLAEGDRVLLHPSERVAHGTRVAAR